MIISRGDSTLRGHYPLETQLLADGLTKNEGVVIDGEIICPVFFQKAAATQWTISIM